MDSNACKNDDSQPLNPQSREPEGQVVVYCASSPQVEEMYFDVARQLGKILAENKITCITGAGRQGLMGAINDSVLQNGGKTKGIIPQFMIDSGWCHDQLTELVVTGSMHERKFLMARESDAAIALPGGLGTLEELAEILTWKQLGLYKNPVVILNVNGFYDPLLALFDKMIDGKFLRQGYRKICQVVASPDEVIDCLRHRATGKSSFSKYNKKEL